MRALVVGRPLSVLFSLRTFGYAEALADFGWNVDFCTHASVAFRVLSRYALIIWDGPVPPDVLKAIAPGTIVVLLGGAGNDISYYRTYADKISLIASTMWYSDNPGPHILRNELSYWGFAPHRVLRHVLYMNRFRRYCSPDYWKPLGIPFVYLPPAANPTHFHPTRGGVQDLRWVFVGTTKNRHCIPWLERQCVLRSIPHAVYGLDSDRIVRPTDLNALYNRAAVCPNECGHGVFFRELNIRTFELGMAGRLQVSDMAWLAAPEVGEHAAFYSTGRSIPQEWRRALEFLLDLPMRNADDIHEYFKEHHSFCARLRRIQAVLGKDLRRPAVGTVVIA